MEKLVIVGGGQAAIQCITSLKKDTIKLMNDDDFYLKTKAKMFKTRIKNNWESIALEWIDYFLKD